MDTFKKRDEKVELIFVNDGSKDTTIKELKKLLTKKDFEIKVLSFSRNFGKDAAMYAGLEKSTGDLVCIIDADLQQKPSLIIPMINELEENEDYDSVCYFQENRIENHTLTRLKSYFYKIMSKISDIEFVDGASDFRLFRRNVVDSILSLKESNRFSKEFSTGLVIILNICLILLKLVAMERAVIVYGNYSCMHYLG